MRKLSRFRGWILGVSILLLFLPTFVLADPIVDQGNSVVGFDLSILKDLPELIVLSLLVLVVIILLFKYVIDPRNKITIKTPEGLPDKVVSKNEMLGMTFQEMIAFMRETRDQYREMMNALTVQYQAALADSNHHSEMMITALSGFKSELTEGRGNQLTAIIDISDKFTGAMQKMESSLQTRNEQMERVNGGIGFLQNGQTKMQNNINALLEEVHQLMLAVDKLIERMQHVDNSVGDVSTATITIKDELKALASTVQSLDTRLDEMIKTNKLPIEPIEKPNLPILPDKEQENG